MLWENELANYKAYLQLERSLSDNSIDAYLSDTQKIVQYLLLLDKPLTINEIDVTVLREFLFYLAKLGLSERSQARILSGMKSFFKFLVIDNQIEKDPTDLLEAPRLLLKLPTVLTVEEIDLLLSKIDLSIPEGIRNLAIIETLYSCGLRVSELLNLKISELYFHHQYIKVTGKGNKERLVPIGQKAISDINNYIIFYRNQLNIHTKFSDYLFLNRRGSPLTRVMIFTITKQLAALSGLPKNVSPHTFRHSFATHLVEGGADLRSVQEMLGHETIITTEIYTHIDQNYLSETIKSYHPRSINK